VTATIFHVQFDFTEDFPQEQWIESRPSSMSSLICQYNGEELDLSDKQIDAEEAMKIAVDLPSCTTLKYLWLGQNHIGDDGTVALARAMASNNSLTRLELDNNQIGDAGLIALSQVLVQNNSLELLDVGYNDFGVVGLKAFANALKKNKGLTGLALSGNSINDESAAAVGQALECNSVLEELFLYDNNFGDEGAISILSALTEHNTTLKCLGVFNNDNVSPTICSAIRQIVDANKAGIRLLHAKGKLDLSSMSINDEQASHIANELSDNTSVTDLILSSNDIDDQGAANIANALVKNGTLQSIWLDSNSIGRAGALAIASALLETTVLKKLFLNDNNIGQGGAVALAEMLQMNGCLRELGLGHAAIGNFGAAAIVDSLKSNATLKILDMTGNNISDHGARAALKVMKEYNVTILTLNLEGNDDISPGLQKTIDFVLSSRRALHSFLKCLCKPLEKREISLVVQAVQKHSMCRAKTGLTFCHEAVAGPIFRVVRGAAVSDPKVIKMGSDALVADTSSLGASA
jgi:Ran GTPase-activating protein (RanGAP) involved in mRNA processing and transport